MRSGVMRMRSAGVVKRSTFGNVIVTPEAARSELTTLSICVSDSSGIGTPSSEAVPRSNVASAFGSLPVRWKASQRRPDRLRKPPMIRSTRHLGVGLPGLAR